MEEIKTAQGFIQETAEALAKKSKDFEKIFNDDPIFSDLALKYAELADQKQKFAICMMLNIMTSLDSHEGIAYSVSKIAHLFSKDENVVNGIKECLGLLSGAAYGDPDLIHYVDSLEDCIYGCSHEDCDAAKTTDSPS